MHRFMSRSKKLIVSAGGVIYLTAILSFLTPVLVESSISWASPIENPSGARKTGVRGIPAGFDVLRKAQKDIQHDLGLPETPSSPSSETRDTSSNGSSPYTAGTLLVIAVMGLFALFFMVYRETRRLGKTGRAETTGFSPERLSDDISEESPAFPEFPDISSLLMKENLAEFPDYELPRNIEQSGRELAEKLDTILSFIRRGLGRFREDVRLSLYHFDESSGFPVLLSLSSGKKYPDFYWPPPLSGLFAEKNIPVAKEHSITGSFLDGTRVETISFPFYDGFGSLFFLLLSLTGEREIPENWLSSGRKLTQNLRPFLEGYARIHYLPVTSTRTKDGGPDSRSLENRMIEELVKGRHLGTRFSLLFIRIASPSLRGNTPEMNLFFRVFGDRLLQCLRSSDLMLSHGEGSFTMLLPETIKAEAHIVLNRAMDIFEEQSKRYGQLGLRFHSDLREIRADEVEHPETILGRLSRLNVPSEGMEPHQYV